MNLLAQTLALTLLITIMTQAVSIHQASVCRQRAWLKSTEMVTRTLLHEAKNRERSWDLKCRLHLVREDQLVSWQRLPNLRKNQFDFPLRGKL